jgi:hypothetical protein
MKRLLGFITFLIVLGVLILFSIANLKTIPLFIWPGQPLPLLGYIEIKADQEGVVQNSQTLPREVPVFLLVFISCGIGIIITTFISTFIHLKDRRDIKKLKKVISTCEREINSLRLIPIKEDDSKNIKDIINLNNKR